MIVTLELVKTNRFLQQYMKSSNEFLGHLGALEHNLKHANLSADLSYSILKTLHYSERQAELAAIAAFLHDIGNLINRYGHGMSGALLAFYILLDLEMDTEEIALIMGAIGNHEEHSQGYPVNNLAAALILADKSDVHRSRVRQQDKSQFTSRDRVNYAVQYNQLQTDEKNMAIILQLDIDTSVCSVVEYFEIFLDKMLMCNKAAAHLKCEFKLIINNTRLL